MLNQKFWDDFNRNDAPNLGIRENTMRKTLEMLDEFNKPVLIVETGSARSHAIGDGQSSFIFEKYLKLGPGGLLLTVDISPDVTKFCASNCDPQYTKVFTSDSVAFLNSLGGHIPIHFGKIDLLYLDSYDVDMAAPHDSALHHMYELVAVKPFIGQDTLVLIDDSPKNVSICENTQGHLVAMSGPRPWGKGAYVAEYASKIGASTIIHNYQILYGGLGK
jgi:hypothetical protein